MQNGKIEKERIFLKFFGKKLNYLSNKQGFLGIDNKFNFKEKVIVVPFGLEKTVSSSTVVGSIPLAVTFLDAIVISSYLYLT